MTNYIFSTFIIMNNGATNFCVQVFEWTYAFSSFGCCMDQDSPEKQNQQAMESYLFVCYKELTHTIMEADKPQDLQSASWRPRKVNEIVLFQVLRPENQESWWSSPSSKVGRLKTQEEPTFQLEFKGRKRSTSQLSQSRGRSFGLLFYLGLQLTRWGSPTSVRAICFT